MDIASNKIDKTQYQTYITLAGGRIRCLRCSARSVRSGEQCKKPAMRSSKTQKCTHHGGRSKGATTVEGKQRIIDANLTHGRAHHANTTAGEFDAPWTLKAGGKEMFTMPKASVMRTFVLNHMVHHRGQMTVYLRMLGLKIPSIYGPSGDERPPA